MFSLPAYKAETKRGPCWRAEGMYICNFGTAIFVQHALSSQMTLVDHIHLTLGCTQTIKKASDSALD